MYEIFFVKQMTAYVVRISDWSSDVCSSDLCNPLLHRLLSGMEGIAAVAARPCRGAYDLHAPLMSLPHILDRKSVLQGKSGSVRVDLGGRRIHQQKKPTQTTY